MIIKLRRRRVIRTEYAHQFLLHVSTSRTLACIPLHLNKTWVASNLPWWHKWIITSWFLFGKWLHSTSRTASHDHSSYEAYHYFGKLIDVIARMEHESINQHQWMSASGCKDTSQQRLQPKWTPVKGRIDGMRQRLRHSAGSKPTEQEIVLVSLGLHLLQFIMKQTPPPTKDRFDCRKLKKIFVGWNHTTLYPIDWLQGKKICKGLWSDESISTHQMTCWRWDYSSVGHLSCSPK